MLEITVKAETGPDLSRPTETELAALLRRIGGAGDQFAVALRIPDEPEEFVQTLREGDGPFMVEYRDGGPEQHFRAECADADHLIRVFLDWARGGEFWRTGLEWRPADLVSTPDVPPELRADAEEQARKSIRSGFRTFRQVAQDLCDVFDDPGVSSLSLDEAARIASGPWQERLAEQAAWPEVTDADRVAGAFAALERQGLTARMNFTCCSGCGLAEIGAERAEGDHGFVFFHYQDTETLADGGGLSVRYGAHADSERERAEVGRTVLAALTEAGLPAEWDGNPDKVIAVAPLDWRKRLPTGD
ncbi:DUF6891 domain-containing protein [Streptomyces sp. NPDC101150]|uniref:DUF6891 domain-containing protein n=1 Tax=Streptomyces sp. NPDC101150 TaxID=3366114 RepID=UPI0037FBD2A7